MTQLSAVTTHVLDTALGLPAAGVPVRLERVSERGPAELGRARTGEDGRAGQLGPASLPPGVYRLVFDTAAYFASQSGPGGPDGHSDQGGQGQREAFFPEVAVTFRVGDGPPGHLHVPLLLSPFGYSTYRGS